MRADFQTALDNLIAASGGRIWIVSGDRDEELQRQLWEEKLAEYGLPPDTDPDDPRAADARQWVAPPGRSNHNKGIAADLGGDLNLAHQLAPQFGLYFPMAHEEWHIEPMGSRETDGHTTPPPGYPTFTPEDLTKAPDYNSILSRLIGGGVDIFTPQQDPMFADMTTPILKLSPKRANAPVFTTQRGGPVGIDAFMQAIKNIESSGGNYGAINPESGAAGAYQFMDETWGYYGGYAKASDAPPELQDERARRDMQALYNKYGSWDDVAAAWYSGENGNWQSSEVQTYVGKVRAEMPS